MTSTVTITGTQANQYTANDAPASPFSGVVVSDSLPGQIETVTINLQPPSHGSLSNLGIGSYDAATGVYTVVGTAAQVTAALQGLIFTPTQADSAEKCTFGIHVTDSAGNRAFDINTTVASAHPITIAASATTVLASVGNPNAANPIPNAFVLENTIGTVMEFLTFNGSVVTAGQFGALTPVAAKQVGDGFEVVWSNGGVWNVASNGAFLSLALPAVPGDAAALEANFGELGSAHQFGGVSLATPVTIATTSTTALASIGNFFELNPASPGPAGPLLEFHGAFVNAGQFGTGWTPLAAIQTGNGYEVAWGDAALNEYTVWNVGTNGDYTSSATGILSTATSAPELAGIEAAFGTNFASVTAATPSPIGTNGELNSVGNLFELGAGGVGTLLEFHGALVTSQFASGWTPVGAIQTGTGYEVAWGNTTLNEYTVWNVDANGDYTSSATGILSRATSATELGGIEANFSDGNFAGVTAATPNPIGSNNQLNSVGNLFELGVGGAGPLLEFHGALVTSQFASGWTPVGAIQTGTGYEVAWGNTTLNENTVWNVDANGNYISSATGILSGTTFAVESLETTFGEDLNGDGTTGPTTSQIATNGVTNVDAVANQFQLNPAGGGTGPFLTLNGSPVTNTQFPAGYTPVGAVKTATGYEVAFWNNKSGAASQFVVWNTDANGNFTSAAATGLLSGSNELAGLEANFGETFTGAGVGKATPSGLANNGVTKLNSVGNLFELTSDASGTGPLLELNGSVVTQGQFGLHPVGALWTGDGYQVAFGGPTGVLAVWNTDANGNFTSVAANTTSAPEVAGIEAAFGDANIAGVTGVPAATTATLIATNGVTTLDELEVNGSSQNGDVYELNPAGGKGGPLLELNGGVVTKGEFPAGYTPVGAMKTADGYEVAFGNGANSYVVWNTDVNGNFTSAATPVLSSANPTQAIELAGIETNFDESFAGLIGATATTIATGVGVTGATTLAELEVGSSQTGDVYELNPAAGGTGPLLEYRGSAVTAGEFGAGWAPVGAVQTATGYEVAWSLFGQDTYTVWNTDLNGNYTSSVFNQVSGQNFTLEDLNPTFGVDLNGAPSLSQLLYTDATTGTTLDLSGQTQTATVNLGANNAFSSSNGGLSGSNPTISGPPSSPFKITLGGKADIVEYTLTPASGIEEITGFNAGIDELNINLRGAPSNFTALKFNDITVGGVTGASIYSVADPSHGVVLFGETAAALKSLTTFPDGHALIGAQPIA